MVKKTASRLARIALWTITAVLVIFLVLMARIIIAPLDVSFAKDMVISQTEELLPGWAVDFDKASVRWSWSEVRLELSVDGLSLAEGKNRIQAKVPKAKLNISRSLLYTGQVKIISLEGRDMMVTLSDLASFGASQPKRPLFKDAGKKATIITPSALQPVTHGLTRFARRLIARQKQLESIEFNNFHMVVAAGEGQQPVNMHLRYVGINQSDGVLGFSALGTSDFGDLPAQLNAKGQLDIEQGQLSLETVLSNISLMEVATSFNLGEILKSMDFPLTVSSRAKVSASDGLQSVKFALQVGAGQIYHPFHFPEKGKMKGGVIRFDYEPDKRELNITEGSLLLSNKGDMRVDIGGKVYWRDSDDKMGMDFQLTAPQASADHVKAFWPVLMSKITGNPIGSRTWVAKNITKLDARDIVFDLSIDPDGQGGYKNGSILQMAFRAQDVVVDYVNGMPPLKGGAMTGVLTGGDITLDVTAGVAGNLPIKGSTVYIDWSKTKTELATGYFNIKTKSQVSDILDLIGNPPLSITDKFTFDVSRLGGLADATVKFEIPLIPKITNEDIKLDARAKVSAVRVDGIMGGEGLRDGEIDLSVSMDQLYAEGTGQLNGVPLNLSWLEDFKAGREGKDAITTRTVISGEIEAADLQAFGINGMGQYSKGKMPVEGTFLGRSFVFSEGYFSADATPATLEFGLLAWKKPVGRVANINGALAISDEKISLSPLTFLGEDMDVQIDMDWDRTKRLSDDSMPFTALIDVRHLDSHQLKTSISSQKANKLDVKITGQTIDLNDLLSGRRESSLQEAAVENTSLSVDLDLKIDRVMMKNGVTYTDFYTHLFMDRGDPESMTLEGKDAEGYIVSGTISPRQVEGKGDKIRSLNPLMLETKNGGELLKGLGVFAHGQLGEISFDGQIMGWQGKDFHVSGDFKMKDMKVVRANTLAPDVTEGVLTGINEFVPEDGLQMKKAEGKFVFKDSILDISSFKANSSNLGITLEGQYEDISRRINMNGVVVPAYGINSFLGNIPLVGPILTGGKGKGIFGVTYRLKGQGSGATFSVNPLSAVTPGFLRNIFEGEKGKVKDVDMQPDEEKKPDATDKDGDK